MKRCIGLVMVLMFLVSVIFSAFAVEATASSEFPIVEEPVTLKVFGCFPVNSAYTSDLENNWFTKFYEEKTNVHLEWEATIGDTADLSQKLQLKLASGDYPDIFLQTPMNRTLLYQSAQDGIFIGLNDLIDNHTVYLKQIFDEHPEIRQQFTAPDGEIYGLGYITSYYHGTAPKKLWIYKPWLDQLGLDVPQTTEEFFNALKAFKENDMNGNGIDDEIPLLTTAQSFLISSFIYHDGSNLMLEDGEVKFVANTDEYREAMRYLNSIYEAGLQPIDVFTLDSVQQTAMVTGGEPRVGALDHMFLSWLAPDMTNESIIFDFVALPPLEGPEGVRQTAVNPFVSTPDRFAITSSCKNPEVAIRWVDWLYSFEGTAYSNNGDLVEAGSGKPGWYYAPEGTVGLNNVKALSGKIEVPMDDPNYVDNYRWGKQIAPWYQPIEWHSAMVQDPTSPTSKHENLLYQATLAYEPYKQNKSIVWDGSPTFFISTENNSKIAEYQTIINNKVTQATAEFTTGVKNIDTDWDEYVAELDALGLQDYLKTFNEEYQNTQK